MVREKAGPLEIREVDFREGSHYPLTLLIDPLDEIRIRAKYDLTHFDDASIQRILAHLQVLLEDFIANPNRLLSEFSLLTQAEKQNLLIDFNNTDTPLSHMNVVQLFEEQVFLAPYAVALRFKDKTLTYGELNQRANQLAHRLKKLRVGPERVVALCLDRSPEAVISILATLKAGGGYLPIDATLPPKRLELMLQETQAPVILTNQELAKQLPANNATIIRLDLDWRSISSESSDNPALEIDLESLAYIIYTSGSTGVPKGAILRHRNLLSYATWARDFYLQGEKLDFPLSHHFRLT
jgi:non-ribosomal peptide synthetase component F